MCMRSVQTLFALRSSNLVQEAACLAWTLSYVALVYATLHEQRPRRFVAPESQLLPAFYSRLQSALAGLYSQPYIKKGVGELCVALLQQLLLEIHTHPNAKTVSTHTQLARRCVLAHSADLCTYAHLALTAGIESNELRDS